MKISVFGIGYVGAVSSACLAHDGHHVIAVDPNGEKVASLNSGRSPIVEEGLGNLIKVNIDNGRLSATEDAGQAIAQTDLSLICVGTPSRINGSLELDYVERVCEQIGELIKHKDSFHSVVLRSTVLPGTTEKIAIPVLEAASGKKAGRDFGVAYYPEFLRESTAIKDNYEPGAIVFGKVDDKTIERLKEITVNLEVAPFVVDIATAEAVKYTNNAWHALKVSFSNEIGNIAKAVGVDGYSIMDILCSDTKLNVSSAYMKPGFAFGGSCLPKDLRALRHKAMEMDVETPILDATTRANEIQLSKAFEMICKSGVNRVGIIGLSFKANTDDLRESPMVELAERLFGKGYDLRIFDANVAVSELVGSNKSFAAAHIPHLSKLLVSDVDEVCRHGDLIVIGNRDQAATRALHLANGSKEVIDLVRVNSSIRSNERYHGICW